LTAISKERPKVLIKDTTSSFINAKSYSTPDEGSRAWLVEQRADEGHRFAQRDIIRSAGALYVETAHQFTVRVSDTVWLNREAPDPVVPVTVSV
jgi:hypothetical protein